MMKNANELLVHPYLLLTPREHVLIGGSPKPIPSMSQPEEVYRKKFNMPVILIERGVDPDLIMKVNKGREQIGRQGGPATCLMFDLKGAIQADFNLEPLNEKGETTGETKLAFVKYSDGSAVDDPDKLKDIGLSAIGKQQLEEMFRSLPESREGDSKAARK